MTYIVPPEFLEHAAYIPKDVCDVLGPDALLARCMFGAELKAAALSPGLAPRDVPALWTRYVQVMKSTRPPTFKTTKSAALRTIADGLHDPQLARGYRELADSTDREDREYVETPDRLVKAARERIGATPSSPAPGLKMVRDASSGAVRAVHGGGDYIIGDGTKTLYKGRA